MRGLGSRTPFAAAALAVVLVSSGLLAYSLRDIQIDGGVGPTMNARRSPAPARAAPELSRTGRLAYWRADPNGGARLFVQNLDGSLRRQIARTDSLRRVTKTRWGLDGDALSYIDGGVRLAVVRLDGSTAEMLLPGAAVADGRRLVDTRWSPDGMKVAATVKRTSDARSDIWIGGVTGAELVRATQLDDGVAAQWLDGNELLVHTSSGLIGVLRDGGVNLIRPITGMTGGSPLVGDDGRIYFLAGRAAGGPLEADPMVTVTGSLWSSFIDGSDARKERDLPPDAMRLDARLPDGSLLVHRGSGSGQSLILRSEVIDFPAAMGLIERLAVGFDRKSALGFTASRVLRVDLTRTDRGGITVLLDGVGDADAWFPTSAAATRPPGPIPTAGPNAKYAFMLGGSLWTMSSDGVIALLRAGTDNANSFRRNFTPAPAWSPRGDRLLVTELGPGAAGPLINGAVLIDQGGKATRLPNANPVTRTPVWSPDGGAVAMVSTPVTQARVQDDFEVRFASLDGTPARAVVPGREVAWTKGGLFVISNGTFREEPAGRVGLAVERIDGTARRPFVTAAALLADPRALLPAAGAATSTLTELGAAADGTYVSVRLTYTANTSQQSRSFLTTSRVSDGRPGVFIPGESAADAGWSPTRPVLGYTAVVTSAGPGGITMRTPFITVVDAATGESLARADGRFAGWAPDGTAFFIARESGLFVQRLGTGDAARISPIGVPVSATASAP